jgi:cysteine desulfurase/selenocysteine lyase
MDWNAFRAEVPATRRWAFFDHAAVAPLTLAAQRTINEYAADFAENGHVNEPAWMNRVEDTRRLFGWLLHCDPLDIAFIKNTSEGIGIVAEGFPWRPGDNVVGAREEYPANIYPWMNLKDRGVELRLVASRDARVWLDDLRAAIDARTRLVTLSFVEFSSGFRNDLDQIGHMCRERGIYFFVDAIQGLGVLPLDLQRTPIDSLSACGHKWLLGPQGAAVLYVRRELLDMLHPVGVGWNSVVRPREFSSIDFTLKPHAGRYESGTLNVAGTAALGASLELLLEIGVSKLEARILELTDYLCDRALAAGLEVYSSRRPGDKSGIVSLIAPGDGRELVRHCRDANIIINRRAGRLRVSPHAYNTTEEIDRLIAVLGAANR